VTSSISAEMSSPTKSSVKSSFLEAIRPVPQAKSRPVQAHLRFTEFPEPVLEETPLQIPHCGVVVARPVDDVHIAADRVFVSEEIGITLHRSIVMAALSNRHLVRQGGYRRFHLSSQTALFYA
jgi:hypothetical protein